MAAALAAAGTPSPAQDQIRRFADPILVLDTGGHHGPIRDLEFTSDGQTLISAGLDKVVYLWDLAAQPPGRAGAIRPAIWRGTRGSINAVALSPPADDGRRVLALAGTGVENRGGTISLYRFPGAPGSPTGDLIGYLYAQGAPVPGWADGHANTVGSMAFAPEGAWLATGSSDGTVKLWDVAARRVVATLDHQGGAVNALAFAGPDRLVTGTSLGDLRVWDLAPLKRQPAAEAALLALVPHLEPNPADPGASAINALSVSRPAGPWLVVGHESGDLYRFDLRAPGNLRASAVELPTRGGPAGQGPVEAVAFGPGNRLAVSIVARRSLPDQRPTVACDVELRDVETGQILPGSAWSASNLVYAMAFSPDGRRFAYGGGDDQAIVVRELEAAQAEPIVLRGLGASVWQVGFSDEGRRVAYSTEHPRPDGARPSVYYGFRLDTRAPGSVRGADVSGRVASLDGWTVTPLSPYRLQVNPPPGRAGGFVATLDPGRERRWWSWTFVPGLAPGHPNPTLAVACDLGVAIFDLNGRRRTRFLHGHEGPVYDVAPSPDGKWLATGSADQTVRLWALAGSDELPGLGAEFERLEDGTRRVRSLKPRGFAEGMGLLVDDVVEVVAVGPEAAAGPAPIPEGEAARAGVDLARVTRDQAKVDELFGRLDAVKPNVPINFLVRRLVPGLAVAPGLMVEARATFGTTRRDGPALSLFLAQDEEWVLWMPRGYYDTSILGDARLLGWHLNNATIYRQPPTPTDFLPMDRFEALLRAPRHEAGNVIARLLETGDEAQALGALAVVDTPRAVGDRQPPALVLQVATNADLPAGPAVLPRDPDGEAVAAGQAVPPLLVAEAGETLALTAVLDANGRLPAQAVELTLDNRPLDPVRPLDLTGPLARVPVRLDGLGPGLHRLLATVRNAEGVARRAVVDLEVRPAAAPPPVPPARPRLRVVTLAPSMAKGGLPTIERAEADARDLPAFLREHLAADAEGTPFQAETASDVALVGPDVNAEAVRAAFRALDVDPLGPGDMLAVVVETHVLAFGSATELAAADTLGDPPGPTVPASEVSEALGRAARAGCRVLLLLDGVHGAGGQGWDADASEWVRSLRNEHGVVVFVASKQGASRAGVAHRAFAEAVLASHRLQGRFFRKGEKVRTLGAFRDLVVAETLRLTRNVQRPGCFVPDSLTDRTPWLIPANR